MYSKTKIFALLAAFALLGPTGAVASIPSTDSVDSAAACSPGQFRFHVAKFDKLSPGASVPNNFMAVNWPGFSVVNPSTAYGINASSGHLVAQTSGPLGVYMNFANLVGQLSSFDFACVGTAPGLENAVIPMPCNISITAIEYYSGFYLTSYGPFEYTFDFEDLEYGRPLNMTSASVWPAEGTDLYFQVTGGRAGMRILVDNVSYNARCPDQ